MEKYDSIDDIMEYMMTAKQKAFNLYTKLANQSLNLEMQKIFDLFAKTSMTQKNILSEIKNNNGYKAYDDIAEEMQIKIEEFIIRNTHSRDINYIEALKLAMERQKSIYRLFIILSNNAPDKKLKDVFSNLAKEEANYRLRFELEYDDYTLST